MVSAEPESESGNELQAVIRTKLPDWVQSTLEVDWKLLLNYLLCVQGDTGFNNKKLVKPLRAQTKLATS
jgi:hypothetical protein